METQKNGRLKVPRGSYLFVGYMDGLEESQVDWLRRMAGRALSGYALTDFLVDGGLDGAIVQHRKSGVVYAVRGEQLMKINGGEGE